MNRRDTTTREFCARCHRVSPVGFHARNDIWRAVAGRHWQHDILCILCFAALGDEKHVTWEEGIRFYPVSYATHHEGRALVAAGEGEISAPGSEESHPPSGRATASTASPSPEPPAATQEGEADAV